MPHPTSYLFLVIRTDLKTKSLLSGFEFFTEDTPTQSSDSTEYFIGPLGQVTKSLADVKHLVDQMNLALEPLKKTFSNPSSAERFLEHCKALVYFAQLK